MRHQTSPALIAQEMTERTVSIALSDIKFPTHFTAPDRAPELKQSRPVRALQTKIDIYEISLESITAQACQPTVSSEEFILKQLKI